MIKWAVYALFVLTSSQCLAWTHGQFTGLTCDITTGVSTGASGPCASPVATCDGVAHDHSAFVSFQTWAIANQGSQGTELIIPSGKNCLLGNGGSATLFTKGIKNLLVVGYGATISGIFRFGATGMCSQGLEQAGGCSARTSTVSSGSNSVTVLASTNFTVAQLCARFTVGNYAVMTGFAVQSTSTPGGVPPNFHYFEYVKITNINSSTGVITFDRNLAHTYESTWPNYNSGNTLQPDGAGPATLFALDASWNADEEFRGLTIDQASGAQTNSDVRSITYRDATFTGTACGIPSQNLSWSAVNTSMSNCGVEADKLVTTYSLDNVTLRQVTFQSSSVDLFTVNNSTITSSITGTPKKTVITGSTIASITLGVTSFGRSDEFICTNCTISAFPVGGFVEKCFNDQGCNVSYTMSGGVITSPNGLGAPRWAVPGTNLAWSGQFANETSFRVIDVTQDSTNTYIQTNLAGGFPSVPLASGKLFIKSHPSPKFTCTNCTGSVDAVDLSQTPAGAPIYSYSSRSYSTSATLPSFAMWGTVQSIEINVTSAYTGATNPLKLETVSDTIKPDFTSVFFDGFVNLRQGGDRLITPSGVTCNGSGGPCSGDTALTLPDPSSWLSNTVGEVFSAGFSGSLAVTVTIQTDQGVVNP